MEEALRTARERWTKDDLESTSGRMRWASIVLGLLAAYGFLGGWVVAGRLAAQSGVEIGFIERILFALKVSIFSGMNGLAMIIYVIFAFIPWYQARKRRSEMEHWTEDGLANIAPALRFETWLGWQKAPFTKVFLGLITIVALAQILSHARAQGFTAILSIFHNWDGQQAAGLVKQQYFTGAWWRLLTAPFLHGNIIHFLMNAAALMYLGKRLEVFARWPHLPLVFLFASAVGGESSARFVTANSVGASGGLMGWLGFLLVFETLHNRLVPRTARKRLAAGVAITALIGIIGFRFVDNAAHAGGLIAGMLYAVIVFPHTSSPYRPRSTSADRIVGTLAMVILVMAALGAAWKILTT